LETFAEIRAVLDAGHARVDVLTEHGLDDALWRAEEERLLSHLADAADRADLDRLRAYQAAYRSKWREVTDEAPVVPNVDPPRATESSPVVALPIAASESATVPQARASYRLAEASPTGALASGAAARRAPPELAGTSLGFNAPAAPLPFVASDTRRDPSEASPSAPAKRAPAAITGTSVGFVAPKGPALPFAPGASLAPSTAAGAILERAALTPAVAATIPPKAPTVMLTGRRPSRDASPWAADVRGTLDGVAASEPVLPFDPNAPPTLSAPTGHVPSRRPGSGLAGTIDATAAPAGPPLPFKSAASPSSPTELSVEQYASLCVELAVESAKADEVLRRYRLTPDERKALDEHWRRQFATQATVWMAYDRAYAAYKKWFLASRK
jgi:hypothetical protein